MLRVWLRIRRSGWFRPGTIGTLLPMPVRWQGWLATALLIALLASTAFVPKSAAAPTRIGLVAAYIGLGIATFE